MTLDEAWEEAEAALPPWEARFGRIHRLGGQVAVNRRILPRNKNDLYRAEAFDRGSRFLGSTTGPTPVEALHKLALLLGNAQGKRP